jgi:SAM-dependent methyltransferase
MNDDIFLAEYSSEEAVRRYTKKTAGNGIAYLLDHTYSDIYLNAIRRYVSAPIGDGVRLLEFGCGGGMNLIQCLAMLDREKIPVAAAYGADFSERLITEASREADSLAPEQRERLKFVVSRSELLVSGLASGLDVPEKDLLGSFHLIIGVNTFRYSFRLDEGRACAKAIYDLLKPGGVCVMIDMNHNFPMFRSMVRDWLTRPKSERYIPKLDEYEAPFAATGFQVLEKKNFCWIPHSAGPALLKTCQTLTPLLDTVAPRLAMRSIVISKKPA